MSYQLHRLRIREGSCHHGACLRGVFAVAVCALATLQLSVTHAGLISFGSGSNTFEIDFVRIGDAGNRADVTGTPRPVGSVPYVYEIAKYEISRDMITKANAVGGLGISMSGFLAGYLPDHPATYISWYEAARFVNWLNTSKGYHEAYRFDAAGNFRLWDEGESWTDSVRGMNRFRHKKAQFWIPSADEWYKAAFYDPVTDSWFDYPTRNGSAPAAVPYGTRDNTAVYRQNRWQRAAKIWEAGGLSPFGVMALGGNVWEWEETAYDLSNNDPNEARGLVAADTATSTLSPSPRRSVATAAAARRNRDSTLAFASRVSALLPLPFRSQVRAWFGGCWVLVPWCGEPSEGRNRNRIYRPQAGSSTSQH